MGGVAFARSAHLASQMLFPHPTHALSGGIPPDPPFFQGGQAPLDPPSREQTKPKLLCYNPPMTNQTQHASFAAGCFWQVQSIFAKIPGILKTEVGYTGGTTPNPSYEQVCTGQTGHAETIHIIFDPQTISYQTLLQTFWTCHDPTQKNKQGPNIGTQYRSAIFTHSEEQNKLARESLTALQNSGRLQKPIATEIQPKTQFWRAEDYHQHYEEKHTARLFRAREAP